MPEKRACSATTKKGEPCKALPLRDRDVCLAHANRELRDATGFGVNGGRPPKPRMVDVVRARMEAEFDAWHTVLEEAREAERAVVVGQGEHATVEYVPDHAIRLAAFREAMDRSYGRPKQATEISGPEGGPIATLPVEIPDTDAYRRRVAQLAAEALGVGAIVNGNGNGHAVMNGNGRNGHG